MTSGSVMRIAVGFYILLFFSYLFGPLLVMSFTAFNSSEFPSISPWNCFTDEWFEVLVKDNQLMGGLKSSLVVGFGVVLLAVPIGLAASLLITQLRSRARSVVYTIAISPISWLSFTRTSNHSSVKQFHGEIDGNSELLKAVNDMTSSGPNK